ncbi:hypothetical protein [Mesorhizobium sp. BR-1-1-10]|uniref:hypothetical protein n=1 Tax=Mesorhizobium sp. BR-1-1-10 TaxID=2876660 RepID=UPI001CD0FB1A|nr:hypothetical protein [Mesorhizobium sp. BR-1-1-10]MBZ9978818.1 hypothetical protein [Mesorhizobium sp. BR-1-1-10]
MLTPVATNGQMTPGGRRPKGSGAMLDPNCEWDETHSVFPHLSRAEPYVARIATRWSKA